MSLKTAAGLPTGGNRDNRWGDVGHAVQPEGPTYGYREGISMKGISLWNSTSATDTAAK